MLNTIEDRLAYTRKIEDQVNSILVKIKEIEDIALILQQSVNEGLDEIGKEMKEIENYFMDKYDSIKRELDEPEGFPF